MRLDNVSVSWYNISLSQGKYRDEMDRQEDNLVLLSPSGQAEYRDTVIYYVFDHSNKRWSYKLGFDPERYRPLTHVPFTGSAETKEGMIRTAEAHIDRILAAYGPL